MNFKAFLKDRMGYGIMYLFNTLLIILVMNLTLILHNRELPRENIGYAFILSGVLLCIYLAFEYFRSRPFYRALNKVAGSNDLKALLSLSEVTSQEHLLYKQAFLSSYRLYEDSLSKYQDNHKMYTILINQWVHQMKTPISVIQLLLEDDHGDHHEIRESILEETQRISHGLEIMLFHARLNQFSLDFYVEPVDLVALSRSVVNEHKTALIKYSLFPRVVAEAQEVVETDKKWIRFVINQIFVNAIKYSKAAEKINQYITITIKREPNRAILTVSDEGIGIPKEDLSRVFEPFFTGKNGRRTAESTGMGMYLSKRVCDELGHKLFVESREGMGTSFSILFYRGKNLFNLTNL